MSRTRKRVLLAHLVAHHCHDLRKWAMCDFWFIDLNHRLLHAWNIGSVTDDSGYCEGEYEALTTPERKLPVPPATLAKASGIAPCNLQEYFVL